MSYYLTKTNPNVFKLRAALDFVHNRDVTDLGAWTACKDAESGDTLFIGQSGEEAGIYAVATVASDTKLLTPGGQFFTDTEAARKVTGKPAWMAPLESLKSDHFVLEETLVTIPILTRVARWLHSQGAVCKLTDEEGEALDTLV